MSELRHDITTGDWVIISPVRLKRPNGSETTRRAALPEHDPGCPFCAGNESKTPPEIMAYRESGAPCSKEWKIRVFPNAFPAIEAGHEVIVESRNHSVPFFLQGRAETEIVVRAYIERYSALAKDPRNKTICIFRNHGKNAGASIAHPHSQIIAAPVESPEILKRKRACAESLKKKGECVYCAIARGAKSSGLGVCENRDFIAFCPAAPKFPYEVWIAPKAHQSSLSEISRETEALFAEILRSALSKIYIALANPDFNIVIHSIPEKGERDFHWFAQIAPRISTIAGFEIGTGIYINPVPPEEAAEMLRNQMPVQKSGSFR